MLPGPAGKLQALQAAGRLETATPEELGLSSGGSGDEVRPAAGWGPRRGAPRPAAAVACVAATTMSA
jgi:hypothetical protein